MKNFEQKIDKRSRKEMEEFLENHFTYWTGNSWNRQQSFANNVKVYNLGWTYEQENNFLDMIYEESTACEVYDCINALLEDFECEHYGEYGVGFNGRSGGYLVLYDNNKYDKIYDLEKCDYEEMDIEDLRKLTELVTDFDRLTDNVCATGLDFAENFEVVEEKVMVEKPSKYYRKKKVHNKRKGEENYDII